MSIARHLGRANSIVLLAVALGPATVVAQPSEKGPSKADRAAARQAYDKGTSAFDKGDYVAALDSFVKANALIPSVQAMFWIAQAQDRLGRTDAAIEAYEAITARADFDKLSPEKANTVRERLAALKPPPAPEPAPAPAPEPPPAPAPATEPPPAVEPPPPAAAPLPVEPAPSWVPKAGTAELGFLLGMMIPPAEHNLVGRGQTHHEFDGPAWQVGLNAAYYPLAALGFEADWAHGIGSVKAEPGRTSGSASFDTVRAHVVGQLPDARLVPFVLLGAGILHGSSDQNGSDTDFALHGGAGLKFFATKLVVPRLDVRATISQKQGGTLSDGLVVYPEVLLGVGFRLGG